MLLIRVFCVPQAVSIVWLLFPFDKDFRVCSWQFFPELQDFLLLWICRHHCCHPCPSLLSLRLIPLVGVHRVSLPDLFRLFLRSYDGFSSYPLSSPRFCSPCCSFKFFFSLLCSYYFYFVSFSLCVCAFVFVACPVCNLILSSMDS